ncbi:MAG: hypothetical protein HYZ47_03855 [Simkania negevensis]|nr:hypothetical protein [Simkania negevensis]
MKRRFIIENGFQIVMLFFISLWEIIKPKMISLNLINSEIKYIEAEKDTLRAATEKDQLHALNTLFFHIACMGSDCSSEFSEVLVKVLGIPKEKQAGIIVTEEQLFSVAEEFCKLHHERFDHKLGYTLDLLEEMRKHPEKHKEEWALWEKAITDVTEKGLQSAGEFDLDW